MRSKRSDPPIRPRTRWLLAVTTMVLLLAGAALVYVSVDEGPLELHAIPSPDLCCSGGESSGSSPPDSCEARFSYEVDGLTVTVDASNSDGDISAYEWTWGDGQSDTTGGPTAEHTYDAPDTYTVTLAITCDDGSDEAEEDISVDNPDDGTGGDDGVDGDDGSATDVASDDGGSGGAPGDKTDDLRDEVADQSSDLLNGDPSADDGDPGDGQPATEDGSTDEGKGGLGPLLALVGAAIAATGGILFLVHRHLNR